MRTLIRLGAAMSFAFATYAAAGVMAQEQSTPLALVCAERDVLVITLLEDHGRAQDVSSEALGKAGLNRIRAYTTCYEGRVAEAVLIYDGIVADLGPVIMRAAR